MNRWTSDVLYEGLIADLLAGTLAMSAWFARLHPGLGREIREHEDPELRTEETETT